MAAVDVLFEELRRRGGSDLHVAVQNPPRARVDGHLVVLRETPLSAKDVEDLLLEVISPIDRARFATGLDLTFALENRSGARIRARYYMTHAGMAATFRLVPDHVPRAGDVGLPDEVLRLAEPRAGLVVVAGPASSGKSTTAAVLIDQIARSRACSIVTIENPIEFVFESDHAQITQREVGQHVPSLIAALDNAAREDADVVFAPSLASSAEVERALSLALDGVLVLTTVEAGSRSGALDRLVRTAEPERRSRVGERLAQCLVGMVVHERVRGENGARRIGIRETVFGPSASALSRPLGSPEPPEDEHATIPGRKS